MQEAAALLEKKGDCTFLYFKPSGKWKYEGRGRFPRPPIPGKYYEVDRTSIYLENGGFPGINGLADGLTIIVIPDESCDVPTAYPHMLIAKD